MNEIHLEIPIKLLSENKAMMPVRKGNFCTLVKTPLMRDWLYTIDCLLEDHKPIFDKFASEHNRLTHGLELWVMHSTPNFLTQEGTISERSGDVDNIKNFIDSVFKNFENLKDSQVVALHSFKGYGEDYSIYLKIKSIKHEKFANSLVIVDNLFNGFTRDCL